MLTAGLVFNFCTPELIGILVGLFYLLLDILLLVLGFTIVLDVVLVVDNIFLSELGFLVTGPILLPLELLLIIF